MPIYEYECKACGHRLEAMQKMNDAPLMDCPACGKAELHKLMSAANVHTGAALSPSCGAGAAATPPCCGGGACPAMD